ncbi:hypothetical protein JKF63_07796 [Porcisia hertigi]|uniref:Uncharacterized protein n=1 Tax=Porcisia hertigi TaxID=2761500 RepID=A0A836LMC6_9TRYP|nr:hypothetical protein JKF63_07796 [Porcisia hertigi]
MGNCCGGVALATTASPPSSPSSSHRQKSATLTSKSTTPKDTTQRRRGELKCMSAAVGVVALPNSSVAHGRRRLHGVAVTAAQFTATSAHVDVATPAHLPHELHMSAQNTLPQRGSVNSSGSDPLMPDLFYISASSSSTQLENCETCDNAENGIGARQDGDIQSSLVEVSQPTQSFRGDVHTYSEMDITSEWEPPSFDRLGRRSDRGRRSGQDCYRLHHLIIRESETRVSLTGMYTHQHQRLLRYLTEERLIAEHLRMLQEYESEWTAQCVGWIVAVERLVRECVAREWWTERAVLARRVGLFRTPPPPPARDDATPDTEASRKMQREDSLALLSNSHTAADLTSSEEAGEDDTSNVCSPLVRASSSLALSAPSVFWQQQERHLTHTRSAPATAGVSRRRHSTPRVSALLPVSHVVSYRSAPSSPLSRGRAMTAQKALHDRVT